MTASRQEVYSCPDMGEQRRVLGSQVSVTGRIQYAPGKYLQPEEVEKLRKVKDKSRWARRAERSRGVWRGIRDGIIGRTLRMRMVTMKNRADRMLG